METVIDWLGTDEADEWRRTAARAPIHHPGCGSGLMAQIIAVPGAADGSPRRMARLGPLNAEHDPCGRGPLPEV